MILVSAVCILLTVATAQAPDPPLALVAEIDRLAAQPLWPGFDARSTPLAIYDGEQTWLFRHPGPPEEFRPVPNQEALWVYEGHHERVRANTSIMLGGVRTATLLLHREAARSARDWAGTAIHEAFHVFQREHHPDWQADEMSLFVYPTEDEHLLHLRRLETGALRRALVAEDAENIARWTRAALALRKERFNRLPEESVKYERNTELNEGLATYVQRLATRSMQEAALPSEGFAANDVRNRAYSVGLALGILLDRFDPSWKDKLEADDSGVLDELLSEAIALADVPPAEFASTERSQALDKARLDVAALQTTREARRHDFFARPGWTLVIIANSQEPLWPQGFDPLNVLRLGAAETLHTRFVKLGNSAGAVEVLNRESLSEGAGAHPIFNGIRKLAITGIALEPSVRQESGKVVLQAKGVRGEFQHAKVERSERMITIRVARQDDP